jgi:hypothetical protein
LSVVTATTVGMTLIDTGRKGKHCQPIVEF